MTQRGTNAIAVYPVLEAGQLGKPLVQPSSGPTPYGFAFTQGGGLVVTEAFGAQVGKAASSYRISDAGVAPVSRSVGNGRSEICLAVVTNDGRYAFTTNFGDGAVSRYSIDDDDIIALDEAAAGLAVDGQTGLRDEDLSGDGRFLYAIDADSRRVFGWAVSAGGSLSPIGSWEGLPATVAGLAVSWTMRLEPLYRATFTTPEAWSVELAPRPDRGAELPDRRGALRGAPVGAPPRRELPAAADRQRPPARLSRRPSDSRRRGGALRMARIRAARRGWNARACWQRYPSPTTTGTAG